MTTNNDENLQLDHGVALILALIAAIVGVMLIIGPAELGTLILDVWGMIAYVLRALWNDFLGFVTFF